MTIQTVNENKLRHRPDHRLNRTLVDAPRVIQQRDVRREIRVGDTPQTSSRQRDSEHLPKYLQPAQAVLADQDKGTIARTAPEARRPIERHLKGFGSQIRRCLACRTDLAIRQTGERKQRNVQSVRRDEPAIEAMRALEHIGEAVNPLCRGRVGKYREEEPTTTTACKLVHSKLEQTMNAMDWQVHPLYCKMHYNI